LSGVQNPEQLFQLGRLKDAKPDVQGEDVLQLGLCYDTTIAPLRVSNMAPDEFLLFSGQQCHHGLQSGLPDRRAASRGGE
jgi:hypothetical protein